MPKSLTKTDETLDSEMPQKNNKNNSKIETPTSSDYGSHKRSIT